VRVGDVAHTEEKINNAVVHSIALCFRHEDFVTTKLFIKKSMDKAFYPF
jgi:hypothetical protein